MIRSPLASASAKVRRLQVLEATDALGPADPTDTIGSADALAHASLSFLQLAVQQARAAGRTPRAQSERNEAERQPTSNQPFCASPMCRNALRRHGLALA